MKAVKGTRIESHAFAPSNLESYYAPGEQWEGLHRYDTSFSWSSSEERRLVRLIDWRVCSSVCLMFFALQLDRGNITQALSDDMLGDLNLSTNDYNNGQTIYFCSSLLAELPSQMISKRLGPDRWIPVQMVAWSIVASMQAFLSGKASFYICRFLLGVIEGGFVPEIILYLSYYYTSRELPTRLSYLGVTNIVSALMAYGILHLRGLHGLAGWRWLFGLEGMLTGVIGVTAWFYLPSSPYSTSSRFRGKNGWFTERQEKIIANRIIRDDSSKGSMHCREAISLSMLWDCLTDYHIWPIYLLGLSWCIPIIPPAAYLTLNLKAMGFDTFQTILLTIPASILFMSQLWFWTWLSEKINQRLLLGIVGQIWSLPLLIALEILPGGEATSHWVYWTISTLLCGFPCIHAILIANTSRNAGSVRTRAVASALYNMSVLGSCIVASQIYRDNDKPLYRVGNAALIALALYNIVAFAATKLFYLHVNRWRERIWSSMTDQEKESYLLSTRDKGNRRLDFRFAH